MDTAKVRMPAVQHLSPVGPLEISYEDNYKTNGFDEEGENNNPGEVWAQFTDTSKVLRFGEIATAGSDKAGGFLQPNIPIRGLSRVKGLVGDLAMATNYDPTQYFTAPLDLLPKLFGIIPLADLLKSIGIDLNDAPTVISEALNFVEVFRSNLYRAKSFAEEAVKAAGQMQDRAKEKAQELKDKADAALSAAQGMKSKVENTVVGLQEIFEDLSDIKPEDIQLKLNALLTTLPEMETTALLLPPLIQRQLVNIAGVLKSTAEAADIIDNIVRFLNGLDVDGLETSFRYEWSPPLVSWPRDSDTPVLKVEENSLTLSVEGRVGVREASVEVLAEFKDFELNLVDPVSLVRLKLDYLYFRAGSSGKIEVDAVIQKFEFLGILNFVERLRALIPFDGFSDPPYLDVSTEGLTTGFSLALPNVAVGVFNLSNISLGADLRVPFLGQFVTVGFNFCTRERPFTLAVGFIGGGGWFLLKISPKRLDVLELGLEAGAVIAVDFGVASGSISAMLGIYMRLEGDGGSLTGYFRLRGEVDVLSLISASIELYLALYYEYATGKMAGRAKLTISVDLFFFSVSVTISVERRFAGSNGDPSFADIMLLDDGSSPAWTEYCEAFSGE
jgi:hypothetical protein